MDQRLSTLAEVLTFAPQQEPQGESNPADHAGHALIARLREAANISNQNVERAMTLAHKLSVQLRAAEDRIAELQDEIECLKTRATAAEQWLETIKHEIEDKLISQLQANRAH
jgi:chromosome segregation ATPase